MPDPARPVGSDPIEMKMEKSKGVHSKPIYEMSSRAGGPNFIIAINIHARPAIPLK